MTIARVFAAGLSVLIAAGFVPANAAGAAEKKVQVNLTGAAEVPPVSTLGAGTADITYDPATREIKWSINTSGLSAAAVAAHIHGPAAEGSNAGVVVNLAPNGMANPLIGSATLTDAQGAEMLEGKYYINIHTSKNPAGEIRGQIKP